VFLSLPLCWEPDFFRLARQGQSAILCDMEREGANYGTQDGQWLEIPADLDIRNSPVGGHHPDLWALVLEARGIPSRNLDNDAVPGLIVPLERYEEALNELRLFEEKNRNWPPPEPQSSPLAENTLLTLSVLVLLATFHNITLLNIHLFGHDLVNWIALGSADSGKILDGQLWRTVTALTLHSGWLHLLGNLAIGGIFIIFLCRDLGSGLAWTLLLASGILGNLANSLMQPVNHDSIGASTIVFGAVGMLGAITLVRYRHRPRKRWALPIAAALGLLALLGTEGENTDLGAHLFGFLSGTGLGLAAEYLIGKYGRPGPKSNTVLALACVGVVISAWWAALTLGH
jgi:rhomboid protease GluP